MMVKNTLQMMKELLVGMMLTELSAVIEKETWMNMKIVVLLDLTLLSKSSVKVAAMITMEADPERAL